MRLVVVMAVALAGCGGVDDDEDREPEAPAVELVPAASAFEPRRVQVQRVEVVRLAARRAEDGRGAMIDAAAPVAIDLTAERWPGRALDPVLTIGELRLRRYSFPARHVIRFVLADASLVPANAEVAIQYGDDVSSRVVVTEALELAQ